ncbi:MAG: DUF6063 family protein [Lachnospiraceae bacterium]|nr:DUF6063 family protein [Lachnospiraceae bacterium]
MKKQTAEVFHALMKKGWIDRSGNTDVWRYYEDPEVQEELETMKESLCFELIRSGDRLYLVPTQDNDLFLKNNIDFRKDISANNEVRIRDLNLLNYLSIYLLYLFFHGEGTDPKCREFIAKEEAIRAFSDHCRACIKGAEAAEQTDYSDHFIQLANAWLSKTDGSKDSMKFAERYGLLNRLLVKFNAEHDDLFYQESGNIRPTRKLDDLMPYFLRKDRISEIQEWIKGVNKDAADL